jgi:molybdopterin converting factor small subunit
MRVTVKLGEPLRSAVGERKVALELPEGATVADLLSSLADTYPRFQHEFYGREIDFPFALFLNDYQIKLDGVEKTPGSEGDTLFIFLPVAGG